MRALVPAMTNEKWEMENGKWKMENEIPLASRFLLPFSTEGFPLILSMMRILVVEDEAKMAGFIKRGLEEEGSVVDISPDGQDGLFRASSGGYDLIVLDITLPLMDGLEVCRKLRENRVSTPILLLTARDSVDMKVSGLDSGADDYLTKPFAFAELLARIRALRRRDRAEVNLRLQVGDLVLDPLTRRVSRGNQPITLTSKEFALLECFMRHPDQVLSRTVLSENVWDEAFDSLTNVIDVYVNYLRNKVDRNFSPKLIHTVRGAGYVMRRPETAGEAAADSE
jgi:heavy metal response regulator